MRFLIAVLALLAGSVSAATFTYTDPACTSYSLSNNVMSCVVAPTPPGQCPPGQTGTPPNCVTPPIPPTPPGPINCPGFTNTVVIDFNWNNPQRIFTGNISQGTAIVVRFTTGTSLVQGNITGAEFAAPQTPRQGFLSPVACDFTTPPVLGWGASSYGSTVYLPFYVAIASTYYPTLQLNTTYYVNVKTTGNCGVCSMYFDLTQ